jgi:adenylate kinase
MRIIMIGPQGAGKGTQGEKLAERYVVPHVATGDLLRAAVREGTPLGQEAHSYMDAGELVPDELVLAMLRERLARPDAADGFILDGYPRNPAQAASLLQMLDEIHVGLDAVVSLRVPDDVLVARLSARRTCPTCGRPFTISDGHPAVCAVDGTPLVQRDDDKPEAIRRRLSIFHDQTAPLISFYEDQGLVVHVDGVGDVDEVATRIAKALADR